MNILTVKKHIPFHKHQVPDHDEMLAKWPGCKTTSTDLRNQLKDKETLHKMGIYLLLAVFQGQRLIAWTWLRWIMIQRKHKKIKTPVLQETNMLDSSMRHFAILICPTFLSLLQKLTNFEFPSCIFTLITWNGVFLYSSSVQDALFSPDHGVPCSSLHFLCKKLVNCLKLLYWCYTFASFNPSAPGSD